MVTKIKETLRKYNMISPGEHVLCALSGGVDSSVLLRVLVSLQDEFSLKISAAHLNHMLRGEDAMRDERFAGELCKELGVELVCERCDVASEAESSGESLETAARRVRYNFLSRAKKALGADKIATAHNANDNLETMLLNLTRGSGIDGMCGIPHVRDDIIRPMLGVTRAEIESFAKEHGISFCEDATNAEVEYSRNKLRHLVVPVLLDINEKAVENAYRASSIMSGEVEVLESLAASEVEVEVLKDGVSCKASKLCTAKEVLAGRVLRNMAKIASGDEAYSLEHKHIKDVLSLAASSHPSKSVSLPEGLVARKEYEKIVLSKASEIQELPEIRLSEGEIAFGEYTISVRLTEKDRNIHNSLNTFCVSCDKISDKLVVRSRKTGDYIRLPKRPTKTLKKLFIEEKIPEAKRGYVPVIADGQSVVAVSGIGINEEYMAKNGEKAVCIEIEEK